MEDINVKSIRYPVATDKKLGSLAHKLGRTKKLLFIQMVDYFYRSKKDPVDFNDELLKTTIVKGQKDAVGFIRIQEKELLIPMKRDMTIMIESQKKLIDCFNNQVLAQNNSLLQKQQEQAAKFSGYDQLMKLISSKLDTKESLKREFSLILDNYIKIRDSYGMMTSGKEKEELANGARYQLKLL